MKTSELKECPNKNIITERCLKFLIDLLYIYIYIYIYVYIYQLMGEVTRVTLLKHRTVGSALSTFMVLFRMYA